MRKVLQFQNKAVYLQCNKTTNNNKNKIKDYEDIYD